MNIFALWGEIEINRKQAEQDIVAVEKQADKSGKKMESSFDKVTKVVATAIKEIDKYGAKIEAFGKNLSTKAGIPLAALTALMGGLAKTTADYGDRVAKQAQQIGLSVQSYQELEYAMGQNGVSTQEFEMSIGNLNQRIGMARRGNEQYRKTLEKLGFNLGELDKGAISTEESFDQIVAALADMDDGQMQAAIASDFFGTKVARRLIPAIRGGTEGVEELRQRAHDLGLVMDEEFTKRSEEFGDTMDDLSRASGGLGRAVGKELLAPLINLGKWVTDIVSAGTEWVKENPKLVRQIIIWGGAITGVLGVLVTLGTTLVITGKIIGALGAVFNILTSKPLLIIAAIGALYLAWESDWLGIRTAVEEAWKVIGPKLEAIIEWGNKTISTVWNWTTETVSAFLSWVQETAWPWIGNTVSTAWDWSTGKIGEFITWIKDVAWPFIGGTVSTAWNWTKGKVSDFIIWIQETAWPFMNKALTTTWNWSKGKVGDFITWVKEVAWPFIDGVATTTWNWVEGTAIPGIKEAYDAVMKVTLEFTGSVYDAVRKGLDTGEWGDFWGIVSDTWAKGVVIGLTLSTAVQGFSAVLAAISKGLGLVAAGAGATLGPFGSTGILGALTVAIQLVEAKTAGLGYKAFAQNLIWSLIAGFAAFGITANPKLGMLVFTVTMNLKWDWLNEDQKEISKQFTDYERYTKEYLESVSWIKRPFSVVPGMDSKEYADWLSLQEDAGPIFEKSTEKVSELNAELTKLEKQALIIAEVFKQGGDLEQALAILGIAQWETRGLGGFAHTDPKTGDVVRGSAGEYGIGQVMPETGLDVWTRLWKRPAEAFDESVLEDIDTNIAMMVTYFMDRYKAEGEDTRLAIEAYNRGTAIDGMQAYTIGVVDWMEGSEGQSMFDAMYKGLSNIFGAWIQAGYDKEPEVRGMAAFVAQGLADYLIGQSPPPKGPLSDIDKGGQNVIEAWTEGAESALKEGAPKLTSALDRIKGLFTAIWDKVPQEIKEPIEQALTWMTGLIEQAEEALFKLDDFQEQLDALLGGGKKPEAEARGFMARLAAGLNEKLDKLDEPMSRLVDAVYTAGATLFEFGKAIASGNWADAFLSIIMETESFALAMEILGKVLQPVISLFDAVLLPIIEAIISIWNFVLEKLASISIFGWRPFARLTEAMIETSRDKKTSGDGSGGSGGRQVSEITGPTRDLLVDLLSPLANFGQIVAPIQDIRNILYERLPNFGTSGMDFAGVGAGAIGPGVVIENITVHSSAKDGRQLARDMMDEIERDLARRYTSALRGRGGW